MSCYHLQLHLSNTQMTFSHKNWLTSQIRVVWHKFIYQIWHWWKENKTHIYCNFANSQLFIYKMLIISLIHKIHLWPFNLKCFPLEAVKIISSVHPRKNSVSYKGGSVMSLFFFSQHRREIHSFQTKAEWICNYRSRSFRYQALSCFHVEVLYNFQIHLSLCLMYKKKIRPHEKYLMRNQYL